MREGITNKGPAVVANLETLRWNKCWHAVHTRSRHEQMAAGLLVEQDVECFLPLLCVLSQWKDRKKWVERPLFPGYLFVRVHPDEIPTVWETRGVVRLLGPNPCEPSVVPDPEVENIQHMLASGVRVDPYPYLKPGQEVFITRGPLKGVSGTLIRKSRRYFLVISVKLLGQSVTVEVLAEHVGGL